MQKKDRDCGDNIQRDEVKSAIRMPIAMPLASGLRPGGTATSRVSHSSSFMVSSHWAGALTEGIEVRPELYCQAINLWRFVSNVERDGIQFRAGRDFTSLRYTNR